MHDNFLMSHPNTQVSLSPTETVPITRTAIIGISFACIFFTTKPIHCKKIVSGWQFV